MFQIRVLVEIMCICFYFSLFRNFNDLFSELWSDQVPYWSLVRYLNFEISPRRLNRFRICLLIWTHHEPYFNSCKFRVISFRRYWEINVYFSETSVVLGQFWTLVPHLVSLITRRSANRFWICLLIWTHHEPYFNSCKFGVISFSRFWEIGLETYGHFDLLVTGYASRLYFKTLIISDWL